MTSVDAFPPRLRPHGPSSKPADGLHPATVAVHAGRPAPSPTPPSTRRSCSRRPTSASSRPAGGTRLRPIREPDLVGPGGSGRRPGGRHRAGVREWDGRGARRAGAGPGRWRAGAADPLLPRRGRLRRRAGRTRRTPIRRVDVADTEEVLAAAEGADLVWLESPTNPMMEVADLPALCGALRGRVTTIVDSTFATPLRQRPARAGCRPRAPLRDQVHLGHSDALMGLLIGRDPALLSRLEGVRKLHGAAPGTMETYLVLRGLRTLPLRLELPRPTRRCSPSDWPPTRP